MALIVRFSLFLRMLVSLGPTGSVVLLYHCTHYTVRGGNSTAGLYCGSLLIHFAVSPGITNWHVGAALSFILFSTHYAVRGGVSNLGAYCGAISLSFFNLSTIKNWWCGATLSLLHIILFVVVFLVVMTIAVYSLFILTMLLVLHTGTIVLLYNMTSYYALHGGASYSGIACGSFCVNCSAAFSTTSWAFGAALSLLHIILFVVVLLTLVPIVVYSLFLLTLMLLVSTWHMVLFNHCFILC